MLSVPDTECEWTSHQQIQTIEDARLSVFQYIETFYNAQRIHQTLDYVTPTQFEEAHQRARQPDS